jgi:hypothetical protein
MSGVNAIWGSEQIRYLLQGGWFPKARIGKRRVVVPVLVSLGVKADGKRVVLDMRLAGEESAASWGEVVASLVRRNLGMPKLALIDGNPGLHAALLRQWPGLAIQRCSRAGPNKLLTDWCARPGSNGEPSASEECGIPVMCGSSRSPDAGVA